MQGSLLEEVGFQAAPKLSFADGKVQILL